MEKIKKSELTRFAKDCAFTHKNAVIFVCMSEEIAHSKIGKMLKEENSGILIEVSKRFAKYATEEMEFDTETSETQDTQNIINDIINCCEENNWFSLGGRLSGSDACDGAGGGISCGGYRDKVRVCEWTHGLQKG